MWSVAVDDALYVRGYNGQNSRWYQAAVRQKAGRIRAAGMTKAEVSLQLPDPENREEVRRVAEVRDDVEDEPTGYQRFSPVRQVCYAACQSLEPDEHRGHPIADHLHPHNCLHRDLGIVDWNANRAAISATRGR
jgi:Uncharacterized protein conserved in bacteria (DUF2255)